MSKRLSKRQLREQQELQALGKGKGDVAPLIEEKAEDDITLIDTKEEEEDENDKEVVSNGGGVFSQLEELEEEKSSSSEEVDSKSGQDTPQAKVKNNKKKKKKKKKPSTAATGMEGVTDVSQEQSKPYKSALGKNKSQKQEKDVSSMSMEEFSALLASQTVLHEKADSSSDAVSSSKLKPTGSIALLRAHLALSAPYLDPSVELKRQFGAAAIKAYENEANSSSGRGGAAAASASSSSSARARAMAWNTNFKVKSILVQPQDTWPPIAKTFTGMTMETIEDGQGGRMGGWVHSRAYRKAQLQFLQAVQSYEPNHLISLLRLYPWHIDTLLQLSDVSRHQGDLGAASDWNARALFAFERTSTTVFSSSLTSQLGPPLLNFKRIEDRGFWIACHRHINFMGRRGTWRTALEWVKLMMGLDPTNDHHGMILWLDFLSIKSRQHAWFLEALQKMEMAYSEELEAHGEYIVDAKTPFDEDKEILGQSKESRGALDWCLGCAYAKALAWRAIEKETGDKISLKSTAALRLAIARHPQVLPLLFDKIGLGFPSKMKSSFLFNFKETQNISKLLALIYVSRSESLWRDADTSSWLLSTLEQAWPTLERHQDDLCQAAIDEKSKMGIYRHILVSDLPDALRQTLFGLIPHEITSNSALLNAYDPLPPFGPNVTLYNDDYFEPVMKERAQRSNTQVEEQAGLFTQFRNALRDIGGLEAWQNTLEELDDDSRNDMMAQILQMSTQQARDGQGEEQDGMPGTFHIAEDQQQEQGAGRDPTNPSTPFERLRQVMATLWGSEERIQQGNDGNTEDI